MLRRVIVSIAIAMAFLSLDGCKHNSQSCSEAEIAAGNTYIQSAVEAICGDDMDVFGLVSGGMCPGHFDISPSQVSQLSRSKVLLVFDFPSAVKQDRSGLQEHHLRKSTKLFHSPQRQGPTACSMCEGKGSEIDISLGL